MVGRGADVSLSLAPTQRLALEKIAHIGLELAGEFDLVDQLPAARSALRLLQAESALTRGDAQALADACDVGLRAAKRLRLIQSTAAAEEGLGALKAALAKRR
jgi:hypothetical protein